jgi:hypothetical protein
MDHSQKKFLIEKLGTANGKHRAFIRDSKKKPPPAVVKAQRVYLEYRMKERDLEHTRLESLTTAFAKAREAILFGTVAEARKLLTDFERQKF